MNTPCPGCRRETSPPHEAGVVLVCPYCGYVGMWDEQDTAWRLLTPEEHAQLMEQEDYLEALQFTQAFKIWRDHDRQSLCALLYSQLEREGIPPTRIEALADAILGADYHSHMTPSDARRLGLSRYGGQL